MNICKYETIIEIYNHVYITYEIGNIFMMTKCDLQKKEMNIKQENLY